MHSSKLVWGLVALSSIVVACGDDSSTTGGGGNGGEATSGNPTSTTTTTSTSSDGGAGPGPTTTTTTTAEGGGTGDGGSGAGDTGGGTSQGGAGQSGSGGAEPVCGDRILNGNEACDADDLGDATCVGLGFYFGAVTCGNDCEVVTVACAGPEICGDGLDNDRDGLTDCSDLACRDEDACDDQKGTVEVFCGNLADEDDDGLIDCQDPDCQAQPECTPGDGPTGSPCSSTSECDSAAGDDPFCISSVLGQGIYLDGYCTEHCDSVDQDCGAGSSCYDTEGPFAICLQDCVDSSDCRPGYDCAEGILGGVGLVCVPAGALAGAEDCDNDLDDDNDGDVDCTDLSCAGAVECEDVELLCNNLDDDDLDGPVDCADDSNCQGTAFCTPGDRPVGAPCAGNNECDNPGNSPLCFPASEGFPSGYCSGWCEADADCSEGGICLEGNCYQGCDALYGCRAGYLCYPGFEICYPITDEELCGNLFDDNGDDLVDCDDPVCAAALACTAPEANCTNLDDDDADGLIDCADPSCATNGDCEAGDQDVGSACDTNTACAAVGDDPLCLTADADFPDGYCSEWCDLVAQDCPVGTVCVEVNDILAGACFETCDSIDDCREGYECVDSDPSDEGEQLICLPAAG